MICPYYSDILIERYKEYQLKIGTYCDDCNNKECKHNILNVSDKNRYLLLYEKEN